MTGISTQLAAVLHISSIALISIPLIRARAYYLDLFKLRNLSFETPSLQDILSCLRLELRRRAIIVDFLDYLLMLSGFLISAIAYAIYLF